jgi:glucose/arabinose dehydrogenase/mono/diheme cytochrome c family protein
MTTSGKSVCVWLWLLAAASSPAALVHQWKFNETSGTTLTDSVGAAHAQIVVLGGGHALDGKRIRLDGGARATANYVLFPTNTFAGLTNVTVELWAVPHSFQNWGRVFDIGPGTDNPAGALVRVAFSQGTNGELQRYGLYPGAVDAAMKTPVDREYHYVMTWSAAGTLTFYRDGVLVGAQNTGSTNIATLAALPNPTFWLGRSHFTGDSTANASWNEVRVYDEVLDAATIQGNFRRGADDTFGLLHRWSFSETTGTNVADSIATATGYVTQLGAADFTRGGGTITLAGGTRSSADYVSFPARRLDGLTNMTIEIWAAPNSAQNWGRVVDIGGTAAGSFLLSFSQGTDINQQRLEFLPSGTANSALATTFGTQYHYVITWDQAAGQCTWYRDGSNVASFALGAQSLANVTNTEFWLARSHYTADSTANATYNEVRLYNRALPADEILFRYQQGPDSIAVPPATATDDSITVNPGSSALLDVLANDTPGRFDANSLVILTPPANGSATVTAARVRYTNSSGSSDAFQYRVTDTLTGDHATGTVTVAISSALRLAAPTLRMPDAPPATSYQVVNAFPGLFFEDALAIATPPGRTNQIFVVERRGIVSYVPDINATNPTRQVFLNITNQVSFDDTTQGERGLLGLAFHPGFETNGYFFVFYLAPGGSPYIDRLARFTADPVALTVNTNTQVRLFDVVDEEFNHNGGDLHFGPDGYLYIGMGDEGGQYNARLNSQRIDKDLYSALLRIDVDKKPGNVEPRPSANTTTIYTNASGLAQYSIPADNPFVNATNFLGSAINTNALRAEIFSLGYRHIWRFSIDPPTGEIWVGDVGQDIYEEVNVVTNGSNCGWSYYEGNVLAKTLYPSQTTLLSNPPPSFVHHAPLYTYVHTGQAGDPQYKGNSITGGVVYRGQRMPELTGAYIFGDFESANLWALWRTNNTVTVQRIAGQIGMAAFGHDPGNGDVLIANYVFNQIQRLVKVDTDVAAFPQTLTDTGAFADLTTLAPNPGVVNYEPIVPFWSDYAIKRRWFAIPDLTNQMTHAVNANWTFPAGALWVKHFDLELERGNPATKKRLETRFLVKTTNGVYGVSYAWNDAGTEASLVADAGTNFNLAILDGSTIVTQQWGIPSRAQCLACHTPAGGHALSFTTRQLNQTNTMNGVTGNQLRLLWNAGYLANDPGSPNTLPRHVRPDDTASSLEARARTYFAVNCAQCHQPGGGGPSTWDARVWLTLEQTGLINGVPNHNGGNPQNKLVVPGDTAHSVLLQRIAANGFSRMPPLATTQLDQGSIALLTDWIENFDPARATYAEWAAFYAAGNRAADPDGDDRDNLREFLTGTSPVEADADPTTLTLMLSPSGELTLQYPLSPNAIAQVETSTNLMDWVTWDVPGNNGIPPADDLLTIQGVTTNDHQFFRLKLEER